MEGGKRGKVENEGEEEGRREERAAIRQHPTKPNKNETKVVR